jgi:hypothetical protein
MQVRKVSVKNIILNYKLFTVFPDVISIMSNFSRIQTQSEKGNNKSHMLCMNEHVFHQTATPKKESVILSTDSTIGIRRFALLIHPERHCGDRIQRLRSISGCVSSHPFSGFQGCIRR